MTTQENNPYDVARARIRKATIAKAWLASFRKHRMQSGEIVAEHSDFIKADVRLLVPDATDAEIAEAVKAIQADYDEATRIVEELGFGDDDE
ncbi:hypothetical protein [Microbaculum marinum]|uniref:Uncharacterized protein n=1 Tax=Microbaculum marinum TaxID=1764581 RepID=A0AAW9RNE9_9HYPH